MSETTVEVQHTVLDVSSKLQGERQNLSKHLTFHVHDGVYGVEIACVKEIIEYGTITRVPMAPRHIRGVINIRGKVVPIIDLAERLEKPSGQTDKRTCIIVVGIEDEDEVVDLGFVVDMVDEVIDLAEDEIEPAPSFGTEVRSDFIVGMGQVEEKFFVLLDLNQVMSVVELSELVANHVHKVN